jgi:hypothetical protein
MVYNKLARINLAAPSAFWTGAEVPNDIVVHGMLPSQRILLGGNQGSSNAALSIAGEDARVAGVLTASAVGTASVSVAGAINLSLGGSLGGYSAAPGGFLSSSANGDWASNAISAIGSGGSGNAWSSNAASWASNLIAGPSSAWLSGSIDLGGGGAVVGATMLGVGTRSPAYPIHVSAVGSNNVSVFVAGDVLALSDASVKRDVRRVEGALDRLCKMSGYTFVRTDVGCMDDGGGVRSAGLLAQEVLEALPEAVRRDEASGLLSVAYGNVLALVVEAIKELKVRVDGTCQ